MLLRGRSCIATLTFASLAIACGPASSAVSPQSAPGMRALATIPFTACSLAPTVRADIRVGVTFGTDGRVKDADAAPVGNGSIEPELRQCVLAVVRDITIEPRAEDVTVTQIVALVGSPDGRAARSLNREKKAIELR